MFANDNPRPVNSILGKRTRLVLVEPDRTESFILERLRSSKRRGIEAYTILARGPELTAEQIASLQQMVFEPLSYYDGRPIFKRLPSIPEFAFRLHRGESTLDLLVDLHNPGWEFCCEAERHWGWNWVGSEMVALAKALFPEHASEHARSVWKRGAMKRLAELAATGAA
ncbi:MAG: hypothetical protein HYS12_01480 [Planctomycetes bacterium]|nr:hypothetical protein [Planctomycetota bacterium]